MKYFLGIDTSCYTTSVALLDQAGQLVADCRQLLVVKSGRKGLAQSEMVFQHMRNLPALVEAALAKVEQPPAVAAVGVSAYPRAVPDSYMPAFVPGASSANMLSTALGIPLWQLSHQQGHILAGLWSAGGPVANRFLAVHASGGTTELLLVERQGQALAIALLGGSSDLNAGQFVDRIGVALGLPFPAGRHLEQLAVNHHNNAMPVPVAATGLQASFAGPASHCLRLIDGGADRALVAAGVEQCIAKTLVKIIHAAIKQTGVVDVLLVGGVLSNSFIRQTVCGQLDGVAHVYLPQPVYSPDNAVGAAFWALQNGT